MNDLKIAMEIAQSIDHYFGIANEAMIDSALINRDETFNNVYFGNTQSNVIDVPFFGKTNRCSISLNLPDESYVNTALDMIEKFIKTSATISKKLERSFCKAVEDQWASVGHYPELPGITKITKYSDLETLELYSIGVGYRGRDDDPKFFVALIGDISTDPWHGFHVKIQNGKIVNYGMADSWNDFRY